VAAAEIAAVLGGAHRSGGWWRCRRPVQDSRGSTLALRDGKRRLVVKCWAGCEPRDVLAEPRRRGLLDGSAPGHGTQRHFAVRAVDEAHGYKPGWVWHRLQEQGQ
jgi:hypothetical protein